MRMIEAVLLDVDGTLIDSNDAHARAWLDAFTERGFSASFGAVRGLIGMGGDHLIPALVGLPKETDLGHALSSRRAEIFKERYVGTIKPFPRVREMIERMLKDDLHLVVATSADQSDLDQLLDIAGVADLLPKRTTGDEAERSKPDPDIVTTALKKSGVSAHQAVMIGDTPYDLEAAAKAGVPAVAFTSGGWPIEKLNPALAVYAGPADLLDNYDRSPLRRG
jgi:HAD superfamily hydrolase (TIGR01509 family)